LLVIYPDFWYFFIVKNTGGFMRGLRNIAILLCTVSLLYGCAAVLIGVGAGVGIGAYKYVDGRLSREYPIGYAKAWHSINTALEHQQISISNSINEGEKGTIEAVRKDGKKVTVVLNDRGQGVTSISVRVGMFGDRLEAEKIHDEIASVAGIG
jgi:hypothetical protein